jgi:hypothetical protein
LAWKSPLAGKITGHFSPTVFRVVGDVRAPGGGSRNFQSKVRTISLHAVLTGALASGTLHKKKKKKKTITTVSEKTASNM